MLFSGSKSSPKLLKFIACIVAFSFTATSIAWSSPAVPAVVFSNPRLNSNLEVSTASLVEQIEIPPAIGTVEKSSITNININNTPILVHIEKLMGSFHNFFSQN